MSETSGSPDEAPSLLFPWLAQPLSTWWVDDDKKTDYAKTSPPSTLTAITQIPGGPKKTRSNPHGFRHRGQFGAIHRGPRPRKVTLKTLRRFMSAVDHGDFLPIYMNWADMDNVLKVRFGGRVRQQPFQHPFLFGCIMDRKRPVIVRNNSLMLVTY